MATIALRSLTRCESSIKDTNLNNYFAFVVVLRLIKSKIKEDHGIEENCLFYVDSATRNGLYQPVAAKTRPLLNGDVLISPMIVQYNYVTRKL